LCCLLPAGMQQKKVFSYKYNWDLKVSKKYRASFTGFGFFIS
jgi:hypothetical protein